MLSSQRSLLHDEGEGSDALRGSDYPLHSGSIQPSLSHTPITDIVMQRLPLHDDVTGHHSQPDRTLLPATATTDSDNMTHHTHPRFFSQQRCVIVPRVGHSH